jgi:hypothetical protein
MRLAWFGALRAGCWELLLLGQAERTTRAYREDQLASLREHKQRAKLHLRASRRAANPAVALSVLETGFSEALRALHVARGATGAFELSREMAWLETASQIRPPAAAAFAAARDWHVGLQDESFARLDTVRDGVEELVSWILEHVESRTTGELRALRYGRIVAVVLFVALVGVTYLRNNVLVHNVALNKTVTSSPLKVNPPTGAELVDGHTRGTYGVHTSETKNPFVTVDLGRTYLVRDVRMYNRGDGWFDDVLPLTLSVSVDGIAFDDIATRTTHFDVWTVDMQRRAARYVRVSKESGYIVLNAIEVYARE